MPWKESRVVNERAKFCLEWHERWDKAKGGRVDLAELCRVFGISRQTGYKWLRRFREAGHDVRALADRSRRPHTSPTAVPEHVQDAVVATRKAHPRWGPRKLHAWLEERYPGVALPSASAMAAVLKRRGLTTPRRRHRRRTPPLTAPFAQATAPNAVWCIDFKGKFKTGDGVWCTAFTVTDACSRYCIRCEVVEEAGHVAVERILDSAFREFGLPRAIRSDNGPPFAAPGPAGLTRLAVWLLRMGIRLERITPGKPQQNGRHERFHLTLALETASPPKASARAQQRAFDLFRREYNEERPHEALGQKPPARFYEPSSRRYPGARIQLDPSPISHVERVARDGSIPFARRRVFVSTAVYGENVEVEPDVGTRYRVLFGPIVLGHLDAARPGRLLPALRPRKQHFLDLTAPRPE